MQKIKYIFKKKKQGKKSKGMTLAARIWYESSTKSGNKIMVHHPSSSAVQAFFGQRPCFSSGERV